MVKESVMWKNIKNTLLKSVLYVLILPNIVVFLANAPICAIIMEFVLIVSVYVSLDLMDQIALFLKVKVKIIIQKSDI